MSHPEKLTVDLTAYVQQVEAQRNQALNETAQLHVVVDDLLAERDRLRSRITELESEVARLNELLTSGAQS
ncbi:MAG: hypothetical protein IRZ07_04140 [Microbispora sp.]|nr:hypothetical protein [Microbispora sp.]